MDTFDVAIVGAGPGGTTAARILAQGGKKVALIENERLGGTCLNCGCIPTKFLLAATAPGAQLHEHARLGVLSGEVSVNLPALQQRKDRFIKGSSAALGKALASGKEVFVSKVPFAVNPIAQAHAGNTGLCKAVWEGDTLVGMAALGHGASHLVTAAQLLIIGNRSPETLHDFMFAHPTLDELLASAINAPRTPFVG